MQQCQIAIGAISSKEVTVTEDLQRRIEDDIINAMETSLNANNKMNDREDSNRNHDSLRKVVSYLQEMSSILSIVLRSGSIKIDLAFASLENLDLFWGRFESKEIKNKIQACLSEYILRNFKCNIYISIQTDENKYLKERSFLGRYRVLLCFFLIPSGCYTIDFLTLLVPYRNFVLFC